ncbi:MAG TPA: sulfite dehydrogenase, partial [Rhodopila sp.]
MPISRRLGLVAGAGALLGARNAMAREAPPWMLEQGAPAGKNPYGVPAPSERNVIRRSRGTSKFPTAFSSNAPLQDLHGIITPNGLHYERDHGGVPAID